MIINCFLGYVGKNGLTAAVAGDIFAAPPSDNVADAIQAVKGKGKVIRNEKINTI